MLLVCLSAAASSTVAAAQLDVHRVEDLEYGRALFHFFQRNEMAAITQLMMADKRAGIRDQVDEANLLLADLYYGYGLYEESRQLFAQLLSADISDKVQNRIWFNLARLRFDQGHFDQAQELLSRINDQLPEDVEAERKYLLTNLLLGDGEISQAANISNAIDPQSIWRAYAVYNLAVTLIENDDYDKGRNLLDKIGQLEAPNSELKALRDRANLSLGLKQLRVGEPESAMQSLSRVRLEGPLSHQALLASGWAWQRQGQLEKALIPWQLLARRNSIDAATQEAILAIPSSYVSAGQEKLALGYFEFASKQLNTQLEFLDEAIGAIQNDDLIGSLHHNAILFDRVSQQQPPPESNLTAQLHLLLASSEFQREVKRYQELLDIRNSLSYWDENFPAFKLVLDERRRAFTEKLPLLRQTTGFDQLRQLTSKRDQFSKRLKQIETDGNYTALATPAEKAQLESIQGVATRISKVSGLHDIADQQDMVRVLSGLLHYELETDYPVRFWQAKKQLLGLDRALDNAKQSAGSLRRISQRTGLEFKGYEKRISGRQAQIRALHGRVTGLLGDQKKYINQRAIKAIQQQHKHIVQLRLNAGYELAKLYDKLSDPQ